MRVIGDVDRHIERHIPQSRRCPCQRDAARRQSRRRANKTVFLSVFLGEGFPALIDV